MRKPISITPARQRPYKVVEWKIHNVCNYDCSFCDLETKSGTNRWMSLAEYKLGVDKIIDEAGKEGKSVWFRINGGEPTLFPEIKELLSYIRSRGAYTFLLSNGSRTVRWWRELVEADCLNAVHLSYHPEQTTDINHIIEVANLFSSTSCKVVMYVSCLPSYFSMAHTAQNLIIDSCDTVHSVMIRITTSSHGPSVYTPEQNAIIAENFFKKSKKFNQNKIHSDIPEEMWYDVYVDVKYDNGEEEKVHPRKLVNDGHIYLKNWDCWAGKELVRVDFQTIYRGVCEVGPTKNIFSDSIFYTEPTKCPRYICSCPLDIGQLKRK